MSLLRISSITFLFFCFLAILMISIVEVYHKNGLLLFSSSINQCRKQQHKQKQFEKKNINDLNRNNIFLQDQEISQFGELEYECIGSCSCERKEDENEIFDQRISSQIIRRTMNYLFTSSTTLFAFHLAKKHFEDECFKKMSSSDSSCISKSIKSEVEKCFPEEGGYYVDDDISKKKRRYICYGNCVENNAPKHQRARKIIEEFECQKLKKEGTVEIMETELMSLKGGSISYRYQKTAISRFRSLHLTKFCRTSSHFEYIWDGIVNVRGKGYSYEQKQTHSACTAGKGNYSVKCKQVYPFPRSTNAEYYEKVWWDKKKEWEKSDEDEPDDDHDDDWW